MSANTSTLPLPSALPPIQINRKPLWIALLLVLAGALYLNQTVSWRQGALWIVGALLELPLEAESRALAEKLRREIRYLRTRG